jgi:hypothetical protein
MCGTKNNPFVIIFLVSHIDSRVKIIDNERPGASPCERTPVVHLVN